MAIPVAVLFYFQFQSINDLASTSAVVLRQLSQETADAAANDVEDTLKRPHIGVLLARAAGPHRRHGPRVDGPGVPAGPRAEPVRRGVLRVVGRRRRSTANTMLVYNRDSLADDSGDLDRRFRDAPGVGAVILPRLQQLLEHKRAIVAFPATIGGRRKYVQAQLRFPSADRDAISSFVALVVDAEEMRTVHLPAMMKARLATVQHLGGFPQLDLTLRDARRPGDLLLGARRRRDVFVDERSFPLVFFDRELLEYAAPFEVEPETWTLQTGFGNRTIAAIADSSSRPQLALMAMLALVMAAGVFFVAGAAAREVRRGRAEVELRRLGLARPQDAARAHPALRRDARARARAHARTRRRVLPHHQRRGQEADAPDREHPRLLADGGRPAAVPHGAGRPRRA